MARLYPRPAGEPVQRRTVIRSKRPDAELPTIVVNGERRALYHYTLALPELRFTLDRNQVLLVSFFGGMVPLFDDLPIHELPESLSHVGMDEDHERGIDYFGDGPFTWEVTYKNGVRGYPCAVTIRPHSAEDRAAVDHAVAQSANVASLENERRQREADAELDREYKRAVVTIAEKPEPPPSVESEQDRDARIMGALRLLRASRKDPVACRAAELFLQGKRGDAAGRLMTDKRGEPRPMTGAGFRKALRRFGKLTGLDDFTSGTTYRAARRAVGMAETERMKRMGER